MGPAADIILATGALTLANEVVFAPAAGGSLSVNWRVIPATGIAAVLIDGLSRLSPPLATGLAVTALITTLFVPVGNAGSPVANLSKAMGYQLCQ
jgi:hypothetical protein